MINTFFYDFFKIKKEIGNFFPIILVEAIRKEYMKKLFLTILLFVCFINVSAKDYYSSYSTYSDWSTNEVEQSDTVLVEKSIKYKYYHEDIEGNYYLEDENDSKYTLKDETNYYYTDYTDYSKIEPEPRKNRVIESIEGYEYREALKGRYVMLNDIYSIENRLYINEIKVLDSSNNEINYNIILCRGCSNYFTNFVHNGIIDENNFYIENGGMLYLELDKEYRFDEITIKVYEYDNSPNFEAYIISFGTLTDQYLRHEHYSEYIPNIHLKEENYNYTNMSQNLKWKDPVISVGPLDSNIRARVTKIPLYRYKDKYIYYYNSNKIYSDYLDKPTTYYNKQSEDSIYLYRYKKRDKISIQDNIVITNKNESLDNFYESTVPVKIEGTINMNKNGVYHVSFITSFKTIEKDITVNIESNVIKEEYEKALEEKNESDTKYDNLVSEYNDKIKTIEEMESKLKIDKDNYNELLKEYDKLRTDSDNQSIELYNQMIEEINKYKYRINELNMELMNYKELVKNKDIEKNRISKEYQNELLNLKVNDKPKNETNSEVKTMPLLLIGRPHFIIPLIFILLVLVSYFIYRKIKERRNNVRSN